MSAMTEGRYSGSRFKRAVVAFLAGRAMQGGANVLFLLWLVRLLSATEYGAYITVFGLVEFLVPLASFGTLDAIRCYLPRVAGSAETTRTLVGRLIKARILAIGSLMVILLLCWMPLMTIFHFNPDLQQATRLGPLLVGAVIVFRLYAEILEALMEQKLSQACRVLLPVGKLMLIGACLLVPLSINIASVMVIEICITLVCLVLSVAFLRRTLASLPTNEGLDLPDSSELAKFQRHMTIAEWTNAMTGIGAIRMIVAARLGLETAALFGFLHSLQQTIHRYLPANLLTNLIQPVLVSRYQPGQTDSLLNNAGNLLLKINWLFIGVSIVVILVGGDPLITLLSGGKFSTGSQTFFLLILTLIPTAGRTVITLLLQISSLTQVLKSMSIAQPILFVLLLLLTDLGMDFLAGTLFIFTALWNVVTLRLSYRKKFAFHPDWNAMIRIVVSGLLSVFIGYSIVSTSSPSSAATLAAVIISTFFAMALMAISRPLKRGEVALAEGIIDRALPSWLYRTG